jgi:histidinol-phosphatase
MADFAEDLALAFRLADAADSVSLERFRALDLVVETKPDLTPVSDADRAVEARLREVLQRERPDDPILGEEYGGQDIDRSGRYWVLDPIDGTKNYVRGVPVWATLIALAVGTDVVVGVVSAPALGMRWWASRGGGAWTGHALSAGRRLSVSAVGSLADASVSFSELTDPAWAATGTQAGFHALLDRSWRSRAYGDFWSHLLVAEGAVDVAIEPQLSTWDIAALVPVVTEAGGEITGIDGTPAIDSGSAVSTNRRLHAAVLDQLHRRS